MSNNDNKLVDSPENMKIYSSADILIYDLDKLNNIIYKYYNNGTLKSIKYVANNQLVIYNKNGESISTKPKQLEFNQFIKNNYLELITEKDEELEDLVFTWVNELIKKDTGFSTEILIDLIKLNNNSVKTRAIQIAGINFFSSCIETIEIELNNSEKTDVYRGPKWDDFNKEFDEIYSANTFSELANLTIRMIKTKHNNTYK